MLHTISIDNRSQQAHSHFPVVFLHGFGGVGAQWWGLQTAVSFKAATYAFDLPGHGNSVAYPDAGPPKVAARAVLAEMESRGLKKVHLVGHSMGGAISSLIALMAPQKVASMTLLAPGGYGSEANIPVLQDWAAARQASQLQQVMPHFFGPNYAVPEKMIDFQMQLRRQPGLVESLVSIMGEIGRGGVQGVLPVDDILALKLPTSIVWGVLDEIVPVSHGIRLKDRVDLHLLDDVGHSPVEEAADLVCQLIVKQIQDHTSN